MALHSVVAPTISHLGVERSDIDQIQQKNLDSRHHWPDLPTVCHANIKLTCMTSNKEDLYNIKHTSLTLSGLQSKDVIG